MVAFSIYYPSVSFVTRDETTNRALANQLQKLFTYQVVSGVSGYRAELAIGGGSQLQILTNPARFNCLTGTNLARLSCIRIPLASSVIEIMRIISERPGREFVKKDHFDNALLLNLPSELLIRFEYSASVPAGIPEYQADHIILNFSTGNFELFVERLEALFGSGSVSKAPFFGEEGAFFHFQRLGLAFTLGAVKSNLGSNINLLNRFGLRSNLAIEEFFAVAGDMNKELDPIFNEVELPQRIDTLYQALRDSNDWTSTITLKRRVHSMGLWWHFGIGQQVDFLV